MVPSTFPPKEQECHHTCPCIPQVPGTKAEQAICIYRDLVEFTPNKLVLHAQTLIVQLLIWVEFMVFDLSDNGGVEDS